MLDNYGRLNKQLPGSDFEELFGFSTADYNHTFNCPRTFRGKEMETQYGDIKLSGATVVETWSDGVPAILTNNYGKGSTLVFNFEASRQAFNPGNHQMEQLLAKATLGNIRPPFLVNGAQNSLVFRRAAPKADHYFVLNTGDGKETIRITSQDINYVQASDIIDGKSINVVNNGISIDVPASSGVWVRMQKQ
jgi:hypothetical protein